MLGFFKFLYDKNFRVPVLLTNDTEHRVASTLELFMDLAYVAALAALVHYLVGAEHIDGKVIYGFLLRYLSIFALWFNLIWYNNLYENKTIRHRIFMLLIILAVICQQVVFNFKTEEGGTFLTVAFCISRLLELILWLTSTYNKKNTNKTLKKASIFYMIGLAYSATVPLLGQLYVGQSDFIWATTVIMEFILPTVMFSIIAGNAMKKGCSDKIPVHHNLLRERFGLLFLLVIGEGIVAITRVLEHYEKDLVHSLMYAGMISIIAYGLWEIYYDIVQGEHNRYDNKYVIHWSFLNMFLCLGAAMLLGTTPELIYPHHPENIVVLSKIHMLGMAIFNIGVYISSQMRDRKLGAGGASYLNEFVKMDRKAIKVMTAMLLVVAGALIVMTFVPGVTGNIALITTLTSTVLFLVMKQYVAYKSFANTNRELK